MLAKFEEAESRPLGPFLSAKSTTRARNPKNLSSATHSANTKQTHHIHRRAVVTTMHILSQHRYKDAPRHTRTHAPVAPIHALDPCNEWPKCLAPWDGWNGMRWGGMGGCCCEYSRRREMHTSASNPAAQARSIHCCNSITLGTRPLPSNITALVGAGKGNEVLGRPLLAERVRPNLYSDSCKRELETIWMFR